MISMHSSPLAQPGVGDSGGMNVYVRELSSALAQAGVDTTTYVRRWARDLPDEVAVEPGLRVVHIDAGDPELPKEHLFDVVGQFAAGVAAHLDSSGGTDLIHANYWLSGVAGHRIKHQLDLPLVCTFHTLARVKAEGGDAESAWRELAEMEIIGCADAICVSCSEEERQFRRHYGDPPGRVEIVAPGVEHAFFAPGDRMGARQALGLGLGDEPLLLFVGRIQPLKGVDVAVRTLAALDRPEARLVIVGGASGVDGDAEVEKVAALVDELGLTERVHFVAPQPHHLLSSYYRAADVALGAQPLGELRSGRAGGGGLWHPGRGERGRWPADPGRSRSQRLPRGRTGPGGVRQLHGGDPRQWPAGRRDGGGGQHQVPRVHVVPGRRPAAPRVRRSDRRRAGRVPVSELHDTGALAALERQIDEWLSALAVANPAVAAVGRDPDAPRRWFVRMRGEAKEITTVWLTLGQRTLRYETYVMPAPEENHAELYEQLLRRNERLVGAHFSIGVEDAVFLRGELALAALTDDELDRVIGSLYAFVEQCFPSAIRVGFASRF